MTCHCSCSQPLITQFTHIRSVSLRLDIILFASWSLDLIYNFSFCTWWLIKWVILPENCELRLSRANQFAHWVLEPDFFRSVTWVTLNDWNTCTNYWMYLYQWLVETVWHQDLAVLLVYRSGNGLFPCHSGLSVSHDSVFTAEHRTPHSSSEDLDTAQSSSSLSIQQLVLPGVRVSSKESFHMYHPIIYCHCLVRRFGLHNAVTGRFCDWCCNLLNPCIHYCVHTRHTTDHYPEPHQSNSYLLQIYIMSHTSCSLRWGVH